MKAVSGKEMCRVLERNGWVLKRIRGSHHRYEKQDHVPVVVPVHGNKTLKTGTQHEIMKNAGLTDKDLLSPSQETNAPLFAAPPAFVPRHPRTTSGSRTSAERCR